MRTIENEELTEEQWKARYIAYLMSRSNALQWQAEETADAAWEFVEFHGGDETPEEDAQNELDCWD